MTSCRHYVKLNRELSNDWTLKVHSYMVFCYSLTPAGLVSLFAGTIFPAGHCEPLQHLTYQWGKRVLPPLAGHTCPHNSRWVA